MEHKDIARKIFVSLYPDYHDWFDTYWEAVSDFEKAEPVSSGVKIADALGISSGEVSEIVVEQFKVALLSHLVLNNFYSLSISKEALISKFKETSKQITVPEKTTGKLVAVLENLPEFSQPEHKEDALEPSIKESLLQKEYIQSGQPNIELGINNEGRFYAKTDRDWREVYLAEPSWILFFKELLGGETIHWTYGFILFENWQKEIPLNPVELIRSKVSHINNAINDSIAQLTGQKDKIIEAFSNRIGTGKYMWRFTERVTVQDMVKVVDGICEQALSESDRGAKSQKFRIAIELNLSEASRKIVELLTKKHDIPVGIIRNLSEATETKRKALENALEKIESGPIGKQEKWGDCWKRDPYIRNKDYKEDMQHEIESLQISEKELKNFDTDKETETEKISDELWMKEINEIKILVEKIKKQIKTEICFDDINNAEDEEFIEIREDFKAILKKNSFMQIFNMIRNQRSVLRGQYGKHFRERNFDRLILDCCWEELIINNNPRLNGFSNEKEFIKYWENLLLGKNLKKLNMPLAKSFSIPETDLREIRRYKAVAEKLFNELGREPKDNEILNELRWNRDKFFKIKGLTLTSSYIDGIDYKKKNV
jgi:hypothetical protein